jgi:8-oxo-dGTP pyrophosphatase MutT (NUDIX family)
MSQPAAPRQAATVILLRRAERQGFEVFLTRRPESMPFLGGMYCFPGGAVNREDGSAPMLDRCRGLDAARARRIFGAQVSPRQTWRFWTAAARELFEETGILLAVSDSGALAAAKKIAEKHRALTAKSCSFSALLKQDDLYCDLASLIYFSHWQTPAENPVRFDTRFFIAVLPEDQTPLAISEEVIHSVWLTPEAAMQRCAHGELPMIFPTFASLRTLADFNNVESVVAEFRERYE